MSILHEPPSEFRKGYWNIKLPNRPFDLFDDAKQNHTRTIKCPNCRHISHHRESTNNNPEIHTYL